MKSYKLLTGFVAFIFSLVIADGNDDSRFCYDFTLNSGAVISYITANSQNNSFSQDKEASKTDFELLINENRTLLSDSDCLFEIQGDDFYIKNRSALFISYINSYSNGRVLHPPLEQLGSLLI
ncbi:MAG: hypothetical protein IJ681_06350 [Bacteroidales bacterium]|nr:hypothetical protein [Bacteroidales bacterium]